MLLKVDSAFALFVLSGALRVDSWAIKRAHGASSIRFASPEELLEQTGLVPGSVPPFGRPVLPVDLYVDDGVRGLARVAFNAASLTESIVMATADYLRIASPTGVYAFGARG